MDSRTRGGTRNRGGVHKLELKYTSYPIVPLWAETPTFCLVAGPPQPPLPPPGKKTLFSSDGPKKYEPVRSRGTEPGS